jgi:hypothetical protein
VGVGAAVERDEEPRACPLERPVDGAAGEAVAVLGAARDDEARVQPEAAQDEDEERRAADPVDVVVAQDDDLLAAGIAAFRRATAATRLPTRKGSSSRESSG